MSAEMSKQLVSSSGQTLLFAALGLSIVHGILAPIGLIVACAPLLAVGVGIAVYRRWQVLAAASIVGSLLTIGAGSTMGTAMVSLVSVVIIATLSGALTLAMQWSWLFATALIGGGGLLLAVHTTNELSPYWIISFLGGLWLLSTVVSSVQAASEKLQHAERIALVSAAISIIVGATVVGFQGHLTLLLGALIAAQGALLERLSSKVSPLSRVIIIVGATVAGVSAFLWLGSPGLALALGCLAMLLWSGGHAAGSRWLAIFGLIMLGCQALFMMEGHPGWAGEHPREWCVWSGVVAAIVFGIRWMRARMSRADQLEFPHWVGPALTAIEAFYALAGASTLLAVVMSARPVLNIFWAAAAVAFWIWGRRKMNVGLQVVAVAAIMAAAIKLFAFDWVHLSGTMRVLLVFVTGATLLVAPLGHSSEAASHHSTRSHRRGSCCQNGNPTDPSTKEKGVPTGSSEGSK